MFKEKDGGKAILNPNLNEGVQYIMTIKVFMLDIHNSKNIGCWVCVSNNDSPSLRFLSNKQKSLCKHFMQFVTNSYLFNSLL